MVGFVCEKVVPKEYRFRLCACALHLKARISLFQGEDEGSSPSGHGLGLARLLQLLVFFAKVVYFFFVIPAINYVRMLTRV